MEQLEFDFVKPINLQADYVSPEDMQRAVDDFIQEMKTLGRVAYDWDDWDEKVFRSQFEGVRPYPDMLY